MKKRIFLTMIAMSLATGALVFGRNASQETENCTEECRPGCCENDKKGGPPACCEDTEMCCE